VARNGCVHENLRVPSGRYITHVPHRGLAPRTAASSARGLGPGSRTQSAGLHGRQADRGSRQCRFKAALERFAQRGQLGAQATLGEFGESDGVGRAGHERVEPDVVERLSPEPGLVVVGEGYERWLAAHEPRDPGGRGDADDVIVQMYTSGTTGVPKGALTTHGNLAVTAQTSLRWGFDEESVSLTPLPMFHIGGIGWAYCGLWYGAATVLVSEFEAEAVLDVLERRRVTNAVLVPTMLQMLTAVPGAAGRDYSALRSIAYGAAPITTTVLKASLRTFGCALFGLHGLTQSTGGVVALEPEDHDPGGPREHLLRSAGRPYPWVELRVADPARGARWDPPRWGRCGCAARTSRPGTSTARPRRPRR
jgi:acyl-CoA synthetase (AMP-forming)/AMP-acid ligase II